MKTIKNTHLRVNKAQKKATLIIQSLNVGNNFTYKHFLDAINKIAQIDKVLQNKLQDLAETEAQEVEVIANGNFGIVQSIFVVDEFFECLESLK